MEDDYIHVILRGPNTGPLFICLQLKNRGVIE